MSVVLICKRCPQGEILPIRGACASSFATRASLRFVTTQTAAVSRDENLNAKSRRWWEAQGGTEATNRSILELSTSAT